MNRRRILKIAGATVVVAGSALAWRAFDQGVFSAGSGAAYEAWKNWQADDSLRPLRLVRAAILAANPHNSQPWRFRVADNAIDVFADAEAIVADRQQSADSARWFRANWQQLQAMRDGITLDAQSLPPFVNAAAKILPPLSQESADQAWLQATREQQLGIEPRFGTALKELVADASSQALMPFRIDYPTMEGRPSPRRDLKSVLM
jgi:hypothetical protein